MKSVLIIVFATLCAAPSINRRSFEFEYGHIQNSGPAFDQATEADINSFLMQALAENQELNSYLNSLDDDDYGVGNYCLLICRWGSIQH